MRTGRRKKGMANPTSLVAALLLAAALAGCAGDEGKSDVNSYSTSTQTSVGNTTFSGSVSAGPGGGGVNGSVDDPRGNASAGLSWSSENRTGTLSGTGAFVNTPFTAEETVRVENGTVRLVLNLSVEGDELTLSLRAPDCEASECAEEVQTSSGRASLDVQRPVEGTWTAVLELEGTGPVEADYTLEIAQLAPGASA